MTRSSMSNAVVLEGHGCRHEGTKLCIYITLTCKVIKTLTEINGFLLSVY